MPDLLIDVDGLTAGVPSTVAAYAMRQFCFRTSSTSGTGPNLFGLGGANLRQGRAVNLAQANDRQLQRGVVSDTSTQVHEAT